MEKKITSSKEKEKDLVIKWGQPVIDKGWTGIPKLMLDYQHRLDLSPTQLNVLIILLSEWWRPESQSMPSIGTIANRMGKTPRYIRNVIKALKEKELADILPDDQRGLIESIPRKGERGRSTSNEYTFHGLRRALLSLSIEAKQDVEDKRKRNKRFEIIRREEAQERKLELDREYKVLEEILDAASKTLEEKESKG